MRRRRPLLLTVKEVARILDVSESTVRRLVAKGWLAPPHMIVPQVARWFRADVNIYLYRLRRGDFADKAEAT